MLQSYYLVHTVEPPLTNIPNSDPAYAATWHCPDWSAVNAILKNAPKCGHLVFRKADSFFGPTGTCTVQNITWTLICLSCKIVHHCWLSQQLDSIGASPLTRQNIWIDAVIQTLVQGYIPLTQLCSLHPSHWIRDSCCAWPCIIFMVAKNVTVIVSSLEKIQMLCLVSE